VSTVRASTPIREISAADLTSEPERWTCAAQPWVARSLAGEWPLVKEAKKGNTEFFTYLLRFYSGVKVSAFLGEPEIRGRFFYNADMTGFNFTQVQTQLDQLADKLLSLSSLESPPSLYMGSTHLGHWLPGLERENELPFSLNNALASLWLGNRSTVATHFDYPANIACCVAGTRLFTLFPPDQVGNLYIGPWDLTPAGQPISLVDINDPDLSSHPRFEIAMRHAMFIELQPGDCIYIPSLWWHQVESIGSINGLVNFWWTDQPAVFGSPVDALSHALMAIKSLPKNQRAAWKAYFEHYIFSSSTESAGDWPPHLNDRAQTVTPDIAKRLRAELLNNLKR
jgi:hypothetical protein